MSWTYIVLSAWYFVPGSRNKAQSTKFERNAGADEKKGDCAGLESQSAGDYARTRVCATRVGHRGRRDLVLQAAQRRKVQDQVSQA